MIANHALYFADVALRGADGDGPRVLPPHDAVVFDEAHRLEESAATWLGGRVSGGGIRRFVADVDRGCREADVPAPAVALDRVERTRTGCSGACRPRADAAACASRRSSSASSLVDALAALADALKGQGEELDALAARSLRLAHDVESCIDPDANEVVVWAEPDAIAWAPVDVSRRPARLLWGEGPTAVLVSATLQTNGGFSFPRRRLGLDEARELAVGSPYDYAGRRCSTSRGRCPTRGRRARSSGSPTRSSRSARSRAGARSS